MDRIRRYFIMACTSIVHNRTSTLTNLFGLSIALVAFIFIELRVKNDTSFDNYYKNTNLTIGFQTIHAAKANPVKSLKVE